MIVCPHCGWDNPSEASFCTNCGRGLARARASRVASLEEAVGDVRPEGRQRFKALDAAGRTARDHEMPLVRTVPPAALDTPPAAELFPELPGFEGGPGDLRPPAPSVIEAPPLPPLRSAPGQRDSTATLVDFRMPANFAEAAQATLDVAPPAETDELELVSLPPDEVVDAEEFPGLEVPEAPESDRASATPAPGDVAEILPLAALDPDSPLRVARVIEPSPVEVDDFLIPAEPEAEGGAPLALALDPGRPEPSDEPSGPPPALHVELPSDAPRADLSALGEVDLDARADDSEAEDFMDISVNEMPEAEILEPAPGEGELLRSGEIEAVHPELPRAAPPPLREVEVRFLLRPLSNNLPDSRLIAVGDRGLTIGRTDAEVQLREDPFLSPRHLQLSVEENALYAEDLHSLNGTWIRVRTQVELQVGDAFRVGHQLLRLDSLPFRPNVLPARDGTVRLGAPRSGSSVCVTQLGDDGQPRNVYALSEQGARIGRHIADIVFTDDTFMSGTHAVILARNDRAVLRDLGSRNGTWIELRGRQRIDVGDALMLGQTVWRVSRPVA